MTDKYFRSVIVQW